MAQEPLILYLIRHGAVAHDRRTAWTVAKMNRYVRGEEQNGLSPKGRSQAQHVAERLGEKGITRIYASSFLRAQESAEPLAERLGMKVHEMAEIGELNPGGIEDRGITRLLLDRFGKPGVRAPDLPVLEPVIRRAKNAVSYYMTMHYLVEWLRGQTTGGEGVAEGYRRVSEALAALVEQNREGGRVAVFTHGYFILLSVVRAVTLWPPGGRRLAFKPIAVPNGSITRLSIGPLGVIRLDYAFDTRHLEGRTI